jgi:hypothetical protein
MNSEVQDRLSAIEIADQIARTRGRLSHSLMVLDREYALRNAVVHGIRLLHMPEADKRDAREMALRRVVPLSFIGAGLAWLLFIENGDVTGRLLRGIAHIRRLARELLTLIDRSQGEVLSTKRQAHPRE